jgi:hypothetical protein
VPCPQAPINSTKPIGDGHDADEADEQGIHLLEAREDAPTTLLAPEQSLELVATLVHLAVVFSRLDTSLESWYDGDETQVERELASLVAFVGPVHEQVQGRRFGAPSRLNSARPSGASCAGPVDSEKITAVQAFAASI